MPQRDVARLLAVLARGWRLHSAIDRRVERAVVRRHAEVRRALEHGEVGGLLRRSCGIDWIADEPVPITRHPLAGEVDALVRPAAGVVASALEALEPGNVGVLAATDRQPVAMMQ